MYCGARIGLKEKASKINKMFVYYPHMSMCMICIFSSPLGERADYHQ